MPRSLYPQGKSPSYLLDRLLGGPQSRSGRGGEEKNSQPLPELETPTIQPVAQLCTTRYPGFYIKMGLKEKVYEGVDWIHLVQHRDQWRALVKSIMNL
jgi:hypothetical protein